MKYCKDCWKFDRCKAIGKTVDFAVDDGVCLDFDECKQMTNADRIRAMSDEELAEWILNGVSTDPCDYCEYNNGYCDGFPCVGKADAETIKEWLKQPAEDD